MAEKTVMDTVLDPEEERVRDRFQTALSDELAAEAQDSHDGRTGTPLRFPDVTTR